MNTYRGSTSNCLLKNKPKGCNMGNRILYDIKELEEELNNACLSGVFSFDIETAPYPEYINEPFSALNPLKSFISTLSFAYEENAGVVVPISHKIGRNINANIKQVLKLIEEKIFKNDNVVKIAYNLIFESAFMTKHGVFIGNNVADPMLMNIRYKQLMGEIVDEETALKGMGLKAQVLGILGYKMATFEETLNGAESFAHVDIEIGAQYSGDDSTQSLRLYNHFKKLLEEVKISELCNGEDIGERPFKDYYQFLNGVEMPVLRVIGLMQYFGLGYNVEKAEARMTEATNLQANAIKKIEEIAKNMGVVVNTGKTGKTQSIRNLLFKDLKCPISKVSEKTGEPSMDAGSIDDIIYILENNLTRADEICTSEEYKDLRRKFGIPHQNKQILLDLLEQITIVQKYGTLMSTHIIGRMEYLQPNNRICSQYGLYTETSRFNSSKPNAQNIPRKDNDTLKVRNLYEPEKDHIMVLIDYSAQEVRISAELYKDELMEKIIKNGWDMHSFTAKTMFNLSQDLTDGSQVEKKYRTPAKPIFFTTTYGGGAPALQETYKGMGIYKSYKECDNAIQSLKKTYPGIQRYSESAIKFAEKSGYIETMLGYRRLLPDINSENPKVKAGAERKVCNTPVQGTAADVTKMALNRIYDKYCSGELDINEVKIVATIHDEIAFEILNLPIEKIDKIVKILCACMEEPISKGQRIMHKAEPEVADPHDIFGIGESNGWADKYSYAKWREKICRTQQLI